MLRAFSDRLLASHLGRDQVGRVAAAKRAELRRAWRRVTPPPGYVPSGAGPRPAGTYRAARRNAHRVHRSKGVAR